MLKLGQIKKAVKHAEKLHRKDWCEKLAPTAYLELHRVSYTFEEDDTLEIEIVWGQEVNEIHYSATIFLPDGVNSVIGLTYFILGYVNGKEVV